MRSRVYYPCRKPVKNLKPVPQKKAAQRGSTLIELAIGSTVMAMVFAGVAGTFIQSRRLTESSIYMNSALTVVQGYLEQIKNLEFAELPYYTADGLFRGTHATADDQVYTQLDSETYDTLSISPGTPPDASTLTPYATPPGAVDNFKSIDVNDTPDNPDDDLAMNLWIWIQPLEDPIAGIAPARSITIIYNWTFNDGGISNRFIDSIVTVRSVVPTF